MLADILTVLHLLWRELGWIGIAGFLMVLALIVGFAMLRHPPPRRHLRRKMAEDAAAESDDVGI